MYDQISTSAPYINAGKLRGLAVTSLKRSPLFPQLPTVDESGVPRFEEITFNGIVAPAATPREALARLQRGDRARRSGCPSCTSATSSAASS